MLKEVENIYQSLQKEFSIAEKQYSVICIEGNTNAEAVARVLNILENGEKLNKLGSEWNPFWSISERVCHYQTGIPNGYTFVVFKGDPLVLAHHLSIYFPDKLVIVSTNWDETRLFIYKNGHPAISGKDYEMTLRICCDDDESYSSLDYSIWSSSGARRLYSDVCNIVSRLDISRIKRLATYPPVYFHKKKSW